MEPDNVNEHQPFLRHFQEWPGCSSPWLWGGHCRRRLPLFQIWRNDSFAASVECSRCRIGQTCRRGSSL